MPTYGLDTEEIKAEWTHLVNTAEQTIIHTRLGTIKIRQEVTNTETNRKINKYGDKSN